MRVAIVDESTSIRRWLRHGLEADDRLCVVAEAGNADEARQCLRQSRIDVMVPDVDMPGMSGIEFLSRLMIRHPMPVVMVSALTERGSREAVSRRWTPFWQGLTGPKGCGPSAGEAS